ncbi:LLM class F420-dependent oxidoreductase [Mycobacterium sp. E1747]|uniref:LLM class F420-dependent oxidoreductase n=1 Tax=Mycobacterium sp. E1747 TaxID=1834128 RepID=UPI0007FC75C0|nr:LLM class F420-dependent oxidoreductase [Mycobacterium sp. E1747]OBH10421.1 hypothetical protein A5695_22145 [Mycobacterium sp. E1747]
MKFAIGMISTDEGADPRDIALAVEDAGFEALFLGDHTHIPVSRETPFPMPPYGELPREYYRSRDPLITLAAIASVTSTLKLGTGVCLVVERDPILMAKQVATLDDLADGRLLLGVGAGWNLEEMRNHGTDPQTRIELLGERIDAMKQIWMHEKAEYHGKFVDFDPIYSWPKPAQRPHPPIIVGGGGAGVLRRVVAYGDEWMPGHQRDLQALAKRISKLQEMAADAGRDPIPVSIFLAQPEYVETYVDMGVSRCVFLVHPGQGKEAIDQVGEYASAVGLS